jgi:hypothetical protein
MVLGPVFERSAASTQEEDMRWLYLLLPFLALMFLGCEKTVDSKTTTAPSAKENQPPPLPDFSSPTAKTGKPGGVKPE